MAWRNIGIAKAPDDEAGNEQFYIVQFDTSLQPTQPGHVKETKGPFREAVVRDFLATFGQPTHEVEAMFRTARAQDRP